MDMLKKLARVPASEFLATYGPPNDARPITEIQIEQAHGRAPERLLDFWRDHGVGQRPLCSNSTAVGTIRYSPSPSS